RTVINLDELDARLKRPDQLAAAHSLQQVGFSSWIDLLSTYAGRGSDLAPWLAGAEINRDRNLRLQYRAGMEASVADEAEIYDHMSQYRSFPDDLFAGSDPLKQAFKAAGNAPNGGP